MTFIAVSSCILIFYYGPRYGLTNPLVYITITGTIGSLSVMACKGLGVALKQTFAGDNQLTNWLTWMILIAVAGCITVQMNYLNKALDIFNTSVVTPILYVIFTSFVILASAILFNEWGKLGILDIVGNLCGFLTIVSGIFIVQAFKDMDISLKNMPKIRKADMVPQNGYVDNGMGSLLNDIENGTEDEINTDVTFTKPGME